MLRLAPSLCALAIWLGASSVAAQADPVAEGRALYEAGDLEGALDTLSAAEGRSDLTRAQLLSLLETRVLVQLALGRDEGASADLGRLAVIAPERPSSDEFPPEVRAELTRLREARPGPLAVRASVSEEPGIAIVRAEVTPDPGATLRELRVYGRAGRGELLTGSGELRLPLEGGAIEHFAEAIGPGGALLARAGSPERPLVYTLESERSGGDEISPWVWVGVGAGVAAAIAAAVIIGVVASSGGGTMTQPTPPTEMP